jgi:hypothetical protein
MDPIEELIANMTKEGKSASDISKAVQEKLKPKEEPKPDPKPEPKTDPNELTLGQKVQKENEQKAANQADKQKLEAALRFTMNADKFISENKAILPKEISDIFARAEKESYDSDVDKANEIKSSVIQSFFSQQANLDLLTDSQKVSVSDYLKLTKSAKEQAAHDLYQNVFEPTLGMLKRIKKAEQVAKSNGGAVDPSDTDKAYKDKLMSGSQEHYLGVRKHGT